MNNAQNHDSILLKAFGRSIEKKMPNTRSLLEDARKLSRQYFERIHCCSSTSDAELKSARRRDATSPAPSVSARQKGRTGGS